MHIAFFTDGYTPQLNGIATSLEILAKAIETQNHRVSIFAPAMDGYVDQRPRVYRFRSFLAMKDPPLWFATPFSLRVFNEIPKLGLEIAHVHTPFAMESIAYQVAHRANLPLVYTYHTLLPAHVRTVKFFGRHPVPPRLAEIFSAWTCNVCDHIIAPSEKIKGFLEKCGVHRPITVIHNGVAVERFQNQPRGFLRSRLGLTTSDKILLCVGRFTPEKNLGFLVDALARVMAHGKNVYLVLVGQGPLKSELEKQATELRISEHLIFFGTITHEQIPMVYADADVYVTASFSEAHSMAALEALASGLPLVVVRDQSFEPMVKDGQNGFVVEPDTIAFAGRVLNILEQSTLHDKMCFHSRALAHGLSVHAQAQKHVNLYNDLIERKKSHQPRDVRVFT